MILLRFVKIQNFRILRDVNFVFATEADKPLTVIRAENGTGKTTLLHALTWGLFGDEGLPVSKKKRNQYRLRPADWDVKTEGTQVPIRVEIGLTVLDEESGQPTEYEIIREQVETLKENDPNTVIPEYMKLTVFKKTRQGHQNIDEPEVFLKTYILSPALKDVFFVDGDAALKFIQADEVADRRERVESAIRKLLGLEVLEVAQRHLETAKADVVRRLKTENSGTPLAKIVEDEDAANSAISKFEEILVGRKEDYAATRDRKKKCEDLRDSILASGGGDRSALQKDLASIKGQIVQSETTIDRHVNTLRERLNTADLLFSVAEEPLKKANQIFADLEARKVIPNTLPEIVEETIAKGICICGANVSEGTAGHIHLAQTLSDMKSQTVANSTLLTLSQSLRSHIRQLQPGIGNWHSVTKDVQKNLFESKQNLDRLERALGGLNDRIAQIPESNLQLVLKDIEKEEVELQVINRDIAGLDAKIGQESRIRDDYRHRRQTLQAREEKFRKSQAEEKAAKDLLNVVSRTIESLQKETLDEVSRVMNDTFLKMIVNSPEGEDSERLIQKAILTRTYDIKVLGPSGVEFNPDTDLSGAQRRALTVAFLLALINVSGTNAVNVIDTPLGMTSGALRRSFLNLTLENTRQLVLLLTRSEIIGVESILDEFKGASFTMSNTSQYPNELVNNPKTKYSEVLICDCEHSTFCNVCKRKGD